MSATYQTHQQHAAAYEQYVRANWDQLSHFEREEARAFLQAKYQPSPVWPAEKTGPGWTIPVAYVCCAISVLLLPVVFAPAAFGLGIYNTAKGRPGHGVAQMILSVICGIVGFILGMIVWAAMNSST